LALQAGRTSELSTLSASQTCERWSFEFDTSIALRVTRCVFQRFSGLGLEFGDTLVIPEQEPEVSEGIIFRKSALPGLKK